MLERNSTLHSSISRNLALEGDFEFVVGTYGCWGDKATSGLNKYAEESHAPVLSFVRGVGILSARSGSKGVIAHLTSSQS